VRGDDCLEQLFACHVMKTWSLDSVRSPVTSSRHAAVTGATRTGSLARFPTGGERPHEPPGPRVFQVQEDVTEGADDGDRHGDGDGSAHGPLHPAG